MHDSAAVESQLALIPRENITDAMRMAGPLLEPAIARSYGHNDIWSVTADLLNGNTQLWIAYRNQQVVAALIGHFTNFPLMRVYTLQFLGGKIRENWLHFETEISAWAKARGAVEMDAYARDGWMPDIADWQKGGRYVRKTL